MQGEKENLKEKYFLKKPHQFISQRKKDTTCKKNRMLLKQGWLQNMKKFSETQNTRSEIKYLSQQFPYLKRYRKKLNQDDQIK